MKEKEIKKVVRDSYAKVAIQDNSQIKGMDGACCNEVHSQGTVIQLGEILGYAESELISIPEGANLGLGCGNPLALGEIKIGDRVLDLGSGAGFDAFLAARRTGESGHVIGVDFTPEMLDKARINAKNGGFSNVTFLQGDIESLPGEIQEDSIDIVISNCVINLAPNKAKVFAEAFRVLRKGGKLFVSDIVLLAELSEKERENKELISCCVGGAILKADYLDAILGAGFSLEKIIENTEVSKEQYRGFPVESISIVARK